MKQRILLKQNVVDWVALFPSALKIVSGSQCSAGLQLATAGALMTLDRKFKVPAPQRGRDTQIVRILIQLSMAMLMEMAKLMSWILLR